MAEQQTGFFANIKSLLGSAEGLIDKGFDAARSVYTRVTELDLLKTDLERTKELRRLEEAAAVNKAQQYSGTSTAGTPVNGNNNLLLAGLLLGAAFIMRG